MSKVWKGHINETIYANHFVPFFEESSKVESTQFEPTDLYKQHYFATVPAYYKWNENDHEWRRADLYLKAKSKQALDFSGDFDPEHDKGNYRKKLLGVGYQTRPIGGHTEMSFNDTKILDGVDIIVIPYIEASTISFGPGMKTCCKRLILNGSFNGLNIPSTGVNDGPFSELWIYGSIKRVQPSPFPFDLLRVPPDTIERIICIRNLDIIGLDKIINKRDVDVIMEEPPLTNTFRTHSINDP